MLSADLLHYIFRKSSSLCSLLLFSLYSSQIFFVILFINFFRYVLRRFSLLYSRQIFFVILFIIIFVIRKSSSLYSLLLSSLYSSQIFFIMLFVNLLYYVFCKSSSLCSSQIFFVIFFADLFCYTLRYYLRFFFIIITILNLLQY